MYFFALERNLNITYWNKASEKLTESPRWQALGKHFVRNLRKRGNEKVKRNISGVIKKQNHKFLSRKSGYIKNKPIE